MADADAVDAALRALRHRDLSEAELERRLAERDLDEDERAHALATLRRTGLVDDRRFAGARAAALAGRGAGDALVRFELERAGVDGALAEEAIAGLEPERERARRVVERRGPGSRTARYLRGKGFGEESVAAALGAGSADDAPAG